MANKIVFVLLGALALAAADWDDHHEEHHASSPYKFEYSVHDPHTGDVKEAKETRHGDQVKGFYSLKEADGTTREVHYTADKHNGFQAHVNHHGHGYHHGGSFHQEAHLEPPVHKFHVHHKHGASHQYVTLDEHHY